MILSALIGGVALLSSITQTTIPPHTSFLYSFSSTGTLYEAGALSGSTSPYWWVNSGAKLIIGDGYGKTIQGELPRTDPWRSTYALANPIDTDQGMHPQNIFRLVTKSTWRNVRQQVYFKITADELSSSPNRNESNGLLLFNRYVDSQNLYYTGVRVDGTYIIKKKKNGVYTTLAQKPVFSGTYNKTSAPNLIPKNQWVGIRSEVVTLADGSVCIDLYLDQGKTGAWKLVATAYDKTDTIDSKASGGIRTDFMDVEFDDYKIEELTS